MQFQKGNRYHKVPLEGPLVDFSRNSKRRDREPAQGHQNHDVDRNPERTNDTVGVSSKVYGP